MEQIIRISQFILNSFIHIWPYLVITIPLAVIVNLSGASAYISRALGKSPLISIILATVIGAFSPFCSCGVIPVITTLLIGGVPLAPVMSFWISSPSMDPEILLLSAATIGWKLSIWRLSATFIISLSAGLLIFLCEKRGIIGKEILRSGIKTGKTNENGCSCKTETDRAGNQFIVKVARETWKASIVVVKFMSLAFFINALIKFYLPEDSITGFLGGDSAVTVLLAAITGVPFYTSNLTALPLVSGLLSLGMNQGAALAFLVAGPVTTLPAMMAVWGIVKPRIFIFYLLLSLFGAILFGYLFNLLG